MEYSESGVDIESLEFKGDDKKQYFHVLAVDDSLPDRMLLERLLKVSSFRVTTVESGDKALKYLGLHDNMNPENSNSFSSPTTSPSSSSPPVSLSSSPLPSQPEEMKVHLIMTDYCMPGMSGYDLLKRVKGSSWKDVPVVVMSSENMPSRVNMCLEGGADEFLVKPLQLSDLQKLQPYVLRSGQKLCRSIEKGVKEGDRDKDRKAGIGGEREEDQSIKSGTANFGKRKAAHNDQDPLEERLSKIKGLAVV